MTSPAGAHAVAEDGTRIAWSERGSGPAVLLVMGLGAAGEAWDEHVAALSRRFRCLIVDNRGTGASDAPDGPYSTALMADDAVRVLDAAGESAAAVVGISMGGAIAQEIALRHPDRVTRLILTASWARVTPASADTFAELGELRAAVSPRVLQRRIQLLIWSPASYDERADALRAEQAATTDFAMREPAFRAQVAACEGHDTRHRLGAIRVPTLVTAGELDVFTPLSHSEQLAAGIADARLEVFEGSGHAHHWEQLDRFNTLCEEFLDEH